FERPNNPGSSVNGCDDVMRTRHITESNSNQCKQTNTFILAGTKEVKKVCRDAGALYQNQRDIRKSSQPFHVVNCVLRSKKRYPFPKCKYYEAEKKKAKIIIKCTDVSLPVHFHDEADYEDYVSTIVH
uniref:Ribonuclease A-domain domain-containing protein n=1 Tax=Neogobius melanostomus TaxID=47308 RepID=A0A8C6TSH9_9GOBI